MSPGWGPPGASTVGTTGAAGGVHHIELWVPDLDRARASWGWLLGELGYRPFQEWTGGFSLRRDDAYVVFERSPALTGAGHTRTNAGLNHLAFDGGSPADVDALAEEAGGHGWSPLFADVYPHAGGAEHYAAYLENEDGYEVELVAAPDAGWLGVLFLNGTVGAGKTSTADAVGGALRRRALPHQVIDLDALRRMWPTPPDDPFGRRLEARNLRALAANARQAGVRVLVVAGVIEDAEDRGRYERILGPVTVVRLVADAATLRRRLIDRHEPGEERDWHLNRAFELAAIIEAACIDDRVVDTTGRAVADVAQEAMAVLAAAMARTSVAVPVDAAEPEEADRWEADR